MNLPRALFICSYASLLIVATQAEEAGWSASNPLSSLVLSELGETRLRPLFTPSRRPPKPPTPPPLIIQEQVETPPRPPAVVLLGIITTEQGSRAIIKPANDAGKPLSLQIGDDIDAWIVSEIDSQHLVLINKAASVDLALFDPKTVRRPVMAQLPETRPKRRRH